MNNVVTLLTSKERLYIHYHLGRDIVGTEPTEDKRTEFGIERGVGVSH